jgi:hypothetical protein
MSARRILALTAPVPGSFVHGSITILTTQTSAVLPATVTYSVDGQPLPSAIWDTTAVPDGAHSVSATVTDGRGKTATATAQVSVANAPANVPISAVRVTAPGNYNFATNRTVVVSNVDGGTAPFTGRLLIDGVATALVPAGVGNTLTFQWSTTALAAGSHTLTVGVSDARALMATSPPVHVTVDNVPPVAVMYEPLPLPGTSDALTDGPSTFQVHASDGYGVTTVQFTLAGNGRWQIAFHAGRYGHADFSDPRNTITLGPGQVQRYSAACWTYYSCLGSITTTAGTRATRTTTTAAETPAQFEAQIAAEIQTGLAELVQQVPSASLASWACPWNDCGQWTTFYNDPSGTVQSWLPGFAAATFPIVSTQTNPVTYALACGTVGPLNGDHRRYRFEVHTDTTIAQFAAALSDTAFAKA